MRVFRAAVVPHSAARMFSLADDIESYPEFVPWCERTEASRDGENVRGRICVNYRGLRVWFATRNVHRAPSEIEMRLAEGPLAELEGRWRFADLGDGRSRVEFEAEWRFGGAALERMFAGLFRAVFGRFVEAFAARADALWPRVRAEVVFAGKNGGREWRRTVSLPRGATVGDALTESGAVRECPEADAMNAEVGVLGTVCGRERVLEDGDRVEIYRKLSLDPRESRRVRAAAGG